MAVNERHPLYTEVEPDWTTMRDTYKGERTIKKNTTKYLPATAGMVEDGIGSGQDGLAAYTAYITRAVYHSFVSDAVEISVGLMHLKPPKIDLPPSMEYLRERATTKGEGLEMLLRKINELQLVEGRLGLLIDLPVQASTDTKPYIASYVAKSIINWDTGARGEVTLDNLNLVVLEESEHERQGDFKWEFKDKWRVLVLGVPEVNEAAGQAAIYQVGIARDKTNVAAITFTTPSMRGKTLDAIPFTFINSGDMVADPDDPPMIGLANLCLAIYRGEADYRQNLFMQGQDTLVISGGMEEKFRVGANAVINLPVEGRAEYAGVSSDGLPEQREALENDKIRAAQLGGQMLDTVSRERESGDALKRRMGAQTASLHQVALSGAEGLQTALRNIAVWLGEDPKSVIVNANLEFTEDTLLGRTLVELLTAKAMGAPLSLESIHKLIKDRGLSEKEFDEEMVILRSEEPLVETIGGPGEEEDDDTNTNE